MMPYASSALALSSLEKLRRVGIVARILCYAAALLMVGGMIWLWRDTEHLSNYARGTIGLNAPIGSLSGRGYWAALAIGAVPAGLFVAAMLRLAHLFARFGRGLVLEEENAGRLVGIGWLLTAFGVATPIARSLQGIALTFDNPPGQRQIALTIDPGTFGALAAGAVLVAFGIVLREAVRLSDENRSFV